MTGHSSASPLAASRRPRVLLFGDDFGLPIVLQHVARVDVLALVAAAIRPQQHPGLSQLAASRGLPLLIQPPATATEYGQFVSRVRALAPDWIIVNSYSMRIPSDVLSAVTRGAVNVHGALLPQYRGANPVQWAILANESETGVTMHHMTAGFDAGDIVAQRRVPILFQDTWCEVQARIATATEELLAEALPRVFAGTIASLPQDESLARYHSRRRPQDGRIDWDHSVRSIYNLIRALVRPHPGAFYEKNGEKVVIDEPRPIGDVVALKYGPIGERTLASDGITLLPHRSSLESAEAINFHVVGSDSGIGGECAIRDVDWARGTARAVVAFAELTRSNDAQYRGGVLNLLTWFATHELQLDRLEDIVSL